MQLLTPERAKQSRAVHRRVSVSVPCSPELSDSRSKLIMKRSVMQTTLAIGLGAGLGYIAAVGHLDAPRSAQAASEPGTCSPQAAAGREGKTCCSEKSSRTGLLALATTALV